MTDIEKLADMFKILSDPTRLRLVRMLGEKQCAPCRADGDKPNFLCVGALAYKLDITSSAVSQHLRLLRQVGLVRGERKGAFMHYLLDKKRLKEYKAAIQKAFDTDKI